MVGGVMGTRAGARSATASRGREQFLLFVACGYFLVLAPPPPTYWIYIYTSPTFAQLSALLSCSIQQICFTETVRKKKGLWNPTHKEDEDTDIHSYKLYNQL